MICKMKQKELEALMQFVQDAVGVLLASTIELSKRDPSFLENLIKEYEEGPKEPEVAKEEGTEEQLKEYQELSTKRNAISVI